MSTRYAHLLSFVVDHPWAITPEMGSVIAHILARQTAGLKASEDDIAAALVNRDNLPQPKQGGGYAVLPIHGVIAPRMNLLSNMSGGTTFEGLGQQLDELMANKAVRTIVLDINSPGGSVAGATEFARQVMAARTKSIIAQVHPMAASAGYWIASAASKIYASPSSMIGSIGVYAIHDDLTASLDKLGVKRQVLSAGEGKADGVEGTSMSAAGAARRQAVIDDAYARFIGDVVRGRGQGATAEKVRGEWKAHVYSATEALSLGMIDKICTLSDTLAEIETGATDPGRIAATHSTSDTAQEPLAATAQDRAEDDRQRLEVALLTL
jgi:signal peptide peptidase SppA